MSDAPEHIWINPCHPCTAEDDFYVCNPKILSGRETQYTRHDLAQAEIDRLREALRGLLHNFELPHASFETGCCMCGDDMEKHGFHSNHSPTDSGVYYAELAIEAARAALENSDE